jgi:hypothetical protein
MVRLIIDGIECTLRNQRVKLPTYDASKLRSVEAWRSGIEPMLHTRCGGDHSNTSTNSIALAQRTLHRKATTLTRRLCNILNRHRADFPEYDPHTNPLNRCSIYGDIIQIR